MPGGAQDRFDRIEGAKALPADVRQALSSLDRFENLEIGELKATKPAAAPRAPAQPPAPPPAAAPGPEITVVLEGFTYRSGDPDLPADIKVLMDMIREEGYSAGLLARWREQRASGRGPGPSSEPEPEVKVFQGQRVSVIRIDGKVYTSDDPKLTPQMRELFDYLEREGVTPALLEYLRQMGRNVRFRPGA